MSTVTYVDDRGRITIPKELRNKLNIKKGMLFEVSYEDEKIILRPLKSITDRYYGIYKVDRWPKDLDKFMVEAMNRWWRENGM